MRSPIKQWKKYRILVTRVDINVDDIEWSEKTKIRAHPYFFA